MPNRSCVAAVLDHAAARPEAIALADAQRSVTYGAFARDIEDAAARLHAQGIAAGQTVALELTGPPEAAYAHACAFYALNYLGALVLPLTPDIPPDRRERLRRDFGARPLPGERREGGAPPARADDPERLSMIRFSTGSTGEPKAVVVSNAKWFATQEAAARALDYDAADRLLPPVPLPHLIGLRSMLRIHAAGGALVNERIADTLEGFAGTLRRHGVTCIAAAPPQLRWLLRRPVPPGFLMPPLKNIASRGAPLLPEEQDVVRRFLSPNLYIDYGTSDFGMIAVQRPGEAPEAGARLVDGVDAQVVDDSGRPLPEGVQGQLRVRADYAPTGYAGHDAASRFRDGWFHPGDLAMLLPGRRVKLLGRADDLILSGGARIAPEYVEAVLRTHPEVRDAAVVGVAEPIAGEVAVAFVVVDRTEVLDSLRQYCGEHLHRNHQPVAFVGLTEIPRSPEGKVLRARLRELVKATRS